ncbi:hypothetical protein T484DRAFT_1863820, partial [Baffinella frigidus]
MQLLVGTIVETAIQVVAVASVGYDLYRAIKNKTSFKKKTIPVTPPKKKTPVGIQGTLNRSLSFFEPPLNCSNASFTDTAECLNVKLTQSEWLDGQKVKQNAAREADEKTARQAKAAAEAQKQIEERAASRLEMAAREAQELDDKKKAIWQAELDAEQKVKETAAEAKKQAEELETERIIAANLKAEKEETEKKAMWQAAYETEQVAVVKQAADEAEAAKQALQMQYDEKKARTQAVQDLVDEQLRIWEANQAREVEKRAVKQAKKLAAEKLAADEVKRLVTEQ